MSACMRLPWGPVVLDPCVCDSQAMLSTACGHLFTSCSCICPIFP